MKTIGVIGGMGWQGSAIYYRVMNQEVHARLGGYHSARVVLDSLSFHEIVRAQGHDDFEIVRNLLIESALRMQSAGADVLLMACNTVHRFFQSVVDVTSIPVIHIADPVGQALVDEGHKKVGLLGTQATMSGAFYKKRLAQKFGLETVVPDKNTRDELNRMILNDLNFATNPGACAPRLDEIIEGLKERGATAVLLACTEFGLAYGCRDAKVVDCALPAYDTAILHAQSAVQFALDSSQ